jgi:hypothetical protein
LLFIFQNPSRVELLEGFFVFRFKVAKVQRDKGFPFLGAEAQSDKGTKAESAILSSSS